MTIQRIQNQTRRHFLQQSTAGIGAAALGSLLSGETSASPSRENPLAPRQPHFAPQSKAGYLLAHDRIAPESGHV